MTSPTTSTLAFWKSGILVMKNFHSCQGRREKVADLCILALVYSILITSEPSSKTSAKAINASEGCIPAMQVNAPPQVGRRLHGAQSRSVNQSDIATTCLSVGQVELNRATVGASCDSHMCQASIYTNHRFCLAYKTGANTQRVRSYQFSTVNPSSLFPASARSAGPPRQPTV